MAEKVRCKICGFTTIRCGIYNHLKANHSARIQEVGGYEQFVEPLGFESKEERLMRKERRCQK